MVSSSLAVEATGMMRGDKAITYLRCLVGVLVDLLGSIGGGEGGGGVSFSLSVVGGL